MSVGAAAWNHQAIQLFPGLAAWNLHASQTEYPLWKGHLHGVLTPSIPYTLRSYYFNKAPYCSSPKWALRLNTRVNSVGNELHHHKHLMTTSTSPFFSLALPGCPLFCPSWKQLAVIRLSLSQAPFLLDTNPRQHSPFFCLLPLFGAYTVCTN